MSNRGYGVRSRRIAPGEGNPHSDAITSGCARNGLRIDPRTLPFSGSLRRFSGGNPLTRC